MEGSNDLNVLLNDFKISDLQLTVIIKSAIEKNIHLQFLDELKNLVGECDESLQQMCSTHYSSVLESLNELTILRNDFDSFQSKMLIINEQVKSETTTLQRKVENVVCLDEAKTNVENTICMLSKCLPALKTFIQLSDELGTDIRKAHEYYKYLENELIPPIKNFRFIQNIVEALPNIKANIRLSARNHLLEFLVKAKSVGQQVGECVINHAMFNFGSLSNTENYFMEVKGLIDILDFSTLYRYMLIMDEIGVKGKDENFYKNERILQVNILSDWSNTSVKDVFKNFCDHVYRIVGFFVIETFVSNNVQNAFSKYFF